MSYSASAAAGREAALVTNTTQRLVAIDHFEWEQIEQFGKQAWSIKAIGDCGHRIAWLAFGVTGDGHVPDSFGGSWGKYAIGKRKRCPECPPPERKARKPKPPPVSVPYDPDVVYRPAPDELAVIRVECEETARVLTVAGEQTLSGDEPFEFEGETYRGTRCYTVPFDGPRVGWLAGGWSEGGTKVGNGKHRIDRPVWKDAEKLLQTHRCVYVRVVEEPYYNKTRHTAVRVRAHGEELPW